MDDSSLVVISPRLAIARRELKFTFVRSSGPGGQNVNKVNSKAVLRWAVGKSPSLPEDVRARFLKTYSRRINDRGELVLNSQRYRDQSRNIDDCIERLRELIRAVARPPRARRKTRPPRKAKETRLQSKRVQSLKKQRRQPPQTEG
jgi:ribosome-associated protein